MKVLLDECVPRKFKNYVSGHECHTVPDAGFTGKKNGELLTLAENEGFEVFITLDRGIEYQQNLGKRKLGVIVMATKSNRLMDLVPRAPGVLQALRYIVRGQVVRVG